MVERIHYEEFGMLHDNAIEVGLPVVAAPAVTRVFTDVAPDRRVSSIMWGTESPEFVFLHGGAQNAHTWDTVALAIGRPMIAIDLPGHGHSDNVANPNRLSPQDNAIDVAHVIAALAPNAKAVVGMSLGGLTTLALSQHAPALVRRIVLVDITPGVTGEKSKAISNFVQGPATFASFDDLLARTIEHNPGRSESSLRRGILHNAMQLDDGSWMWRYRRFSGGGVVGGQSRTDAGFNDFAALWGAVERSTVPLMLAQGLRPQTVVSSNDVAKLRGLRPDAHVVEFPEAGHSIQGDSPVRLAEVIKTFVAST